MNDFGQFGRYRILEEWGRGAMGVVYKAQDPLLERIVAVKTILLAGSEEERAEYQARFHQEAKAAGGLNHPNIVTVHDIGREGELLYMAMELLDGVDLRERMQQGRLSLELALDIAVQIAEGLGFAHEHGVVHRDIKPANIMIVRERHAKIMDFGIARVRLSDIKTQTGAVLGSPRYMSPEQVNGERADHRSDIFSLGILIYEMVTGVPPFAGNDVGQLMVQVATAAAAPASSLNPVVPATLDLIIGKALEKAPELRYQDARELAADLRTCKEQVMDVALADTVPRDAAVEGAARGGSTIRAVGAGVEFSLSRRFDSAESVQRLADAQPVPRPAEGLIPRARLFLRDRDQRAAAAGMAAAAAAALLIAFV